MLVAVHLLMGSFFPQIKVVEPVVPEVHTVAVGVVLL